MLCAAEQRVVALDHKSIERLGRMNALQSLAMARAQKRRHSGQSQTLLKRYAAKKKVNLAKE